MSKDNGENTSHWSLRIPGTPSSTCMPLWVNFSSRKSAIKSRQWMRYDGGNMPAISRPLWRAQGVIT